MKFFKTHEGKDKSVLVYRFVGQHFSANIINNVRTEKIHLYFSHRGSRHEKAFERKSMREVLAYLSWLDRTKLSSIR